MHPVKEGLIIAVRSFEYYKDFYPDWEVVTVESGWKKSDHSITKRKEQRKVVDQG